MGSKILAYINPDILIWARRAIDYSIDEVSSKSGIATSTLRAAENGTKNLTMKQLRKLAKIYDRSLSTFYSKKVPKTLEFPDFRSTDVSSHNITSQLNPIIRNLKKKKAYANELYHLYSLQINYEFLETWQKISDNTLLAEEIRKQLQITTDDLQGRRDYNVLNYWKDKIEDNGILVFQFQGVDPEITRGMSFSTKPFPLIALNQKDSYYARVFTLIHELVHIIENQDGLCDSTEFVLEQNNIETYCNEVASEVIVPTSELLEHINSPVQSNEIFATLDHLSKFFKASWSVLLIKLQNLGFTSQKDYYKVQNYLLEKTSKTYSSREGGNFYTLFFSKNSDRYMSLVRRGLENRILSYYESMNYLDASYKVMEGIEARWEEEGSQ